MTRISRRYASIFLKRDPLQVAMAETTSRIRSNVVFFKNQMRPVLVVFSFPAFCLSS